MTLKASSCEYLQMLKELLIPRTRFRKTFLITSLLIILYFVIFHIAFVLYPINNAVRDVVVNRNYVPSIHAITGLIPFFIILGITLLIYFLQKRDKKLAKFIRSERNLTILLILISLTFAAVLYFKYLNFRTYTYDLLIDYQAIVNNTRGHFFETSVEVKNLLGDHFAILLLIPTFLYTLIPHPSTLFIIQSLCMGIGSVGIYYLAKQIIKNRAISVVFALIFILFPSLAGVFLFDFHEIALAIPF